MQCDICKRPPSGLLPFYCTLCAREAIHEPRIQLALILIQEEALGRDVERIVIRHKATSGKGLLKANDRTHEPNNSCVLERATTDYITSNKRTEAILGHVEALRVQTKEMKAEIARRRIDLAKRRSNIAVASESISRLRSTTIEPVEKGVKQTEHRWDALHTATLEARVFLCKEAAQLYGLQKRNPKKGGSGKDVYTIGGIPIVNLRELNSQNTMLSLSRLNAENHVDASPTCVTTATTNLAHLVYLVSHYLTLRLPAEITLPHRDYPLPTIFSPGSSYTMREVPFPGSTPSQSSINSPSASRAFDSKPPPRPRPLHIEKKLSVLAKEEPVMYALFVEGMTLLAWDIAWICKTQGLNVGDNSWEEVCAMGKNLWQLLVAGSSVPRPPVNRGISGQNKAPNHLVTLRKDVATRTNGNDNAESPATLGHYSHGTAHSFLAAAEGMEYMRGWRLQSPVRLIESVKAMLLSDRTGAEWEILEGNEWEEERPRPGDATSRESHVAKEEAFIIKGRRREGGFDEGRSVMSVGTKEGEEADERVKGTSGWTKVKSRGGL